MSKIAILMGSPRKNGNTEILVKSFLGGVDKEKNSVEIIPVMENKVNSCTGCNACFRDSMNRCVQQDDMQEVYEKLSDADVIVIATPIYFYGISSQLKCIIDRLHNPIRNSFKVKELVLLAVCADTIPTAFDSVKTMYLSILSYFSLKNAGIITVPGVPEKGDIMGNPALTEAYKLGAGF